MSAAALTPILWTLTVAAWASFIVLSWAAFGGSRIGALTERTFIAFIIAVLGTVASVLRHNTDTGFSMFPQPVAALIFAITMLTVLAIPVAWLVMWFTGRLGERELDRDAAIRRIEANLTENTRISQGARDDAHEAAEAANSVNAKIAAQDVQINEQGRQITEQGRVAAQVGERFEATLDETAEQVHDIHDVTVKNGAQGDH